VSSPPKQVQKLTKTYCPACHEANTPNNKFCRKCGACMHCGAHGAKHAHHNTYSVGSPAPPPNLSTPTFGLGTPPISAAQTNRSTATQQKSRNKGSGKRPLWQIVTLCLIWATVGIILFLGRPTQSQSPVEAVIEPTPVTEPTSTPLPTTSPVLNVKETDRQKVDLEDEKGNKTGEAEILLLDDEDVWVQGKDDEIQYIGKIRNKGRGLFDESLVQNIITSPEIVVISTADQKGSREGEENRTERRGLNIKREIASAKGNHNVSYIALGQWVPSLDPRCKNAGVDAQRRIIIIRVLSRDKNQPLGPALQRAVAKLQNEHDVYKDISLCYSRSQEFTLR
jgi:hypothetical protein